MKRSALVLLLVMTAAAPALAGNDLLNMGKELLEGQGSSASSSGSKVPAGLSDQKMISGIREALRVCTEKALKKVGKPGGFLNDSAVRIPLPRPLAKVKSGLAMIGAESLTDDLETRINKAAETAAPKAASIFGKAVSNMSIDDARGILGGPSDSATQYFKRTTSPELTEALLPVIRKNLADVGALKSYSSLTAKVKTLPLASNVELDMEDYVARKTLDGIFYYLAKQEADIRANPAARTTDLLKSVFR